MNSHLATCSRKKLTELPRFSDADKKLFTTLFVRWNFIRYIRNDKHLEGLKLIDARNNPLNCSNLPRWINLKTDCQNKLMQQSQEIFSREKTKDDTTNVMQITSPSTFPFISEFDKSLPDLSASYSRSTPTITLTTVKAAPSSPEEISPKELSIKISTHTSDITSRNESTDKLFIVTPNRNMEEQNSLDFYLHVTLGPAAVLYILATIAFCVRYYLRRRQRNHPSFLEM